MKRLFPVFAGSIVMLVLFTSVAFADGNASTHRVSSSETHRLAQIAAFESPINPHAPANAATSSGICSYNNTARIYEGAPVNQCVGFFGTGYLAGKWSPIASVYAYAYPVWIRYYDYAFAGYCYVAAGHFVYGQNTSGTITQINPGSTGGYPLCQNPLPPGR